MGLKFRNKKTGEIADLDDWTLIGANDCITVESDHDRKKIFNYESLAKLNEEWEDYEPEEPKITDPEWRHVVRKWYKLNGLEEELKVSIDARNYMIIGWRKDEGVHGQEIDIPLSAMECGKHFFDGIRYTINELCGEEEE